MPPLTCAGRALHALTHPAPAGPLSDPPPKRHPSAGAEQLLPTRCHRPACLGAQLTQWALLLSQARQELLGTSGRVPALLAQARLAGLRAEAAVLAAAPEAEEPV